MSLVALAAILAAAIAVAWYLFAGPLAKASQLNHRVDSFKGIAQGLGLNIPGL